MAESSDKKEPSQGGSAWSAAHLTMTIPVLVFIACTVYVLVVWSARSDSAPATRDIQAPLSNATPTPSATEEATTTKPPTNVPRDIAPTDRK